MTDQQTSSTSSSEELKLLIRKMFLPLAAVIVVVALIGDAIATNVLTKKAKLSNTYKVAKLVDRENYLNEIPIFGPSMARNAFYCDSLGPNYFNYAMENAGPIIVQTLLTLETEKDKTTPVIIDYHFREFEKDSTGSSINIRTYLPFVNRNKIIRQFLQDNHRFRPHQRIPGGRYFGVYSSYAKDYLAEVYQPRKFYHRGGVFNKKAPSQEQMDRLIQYRRDNGPKPFVFNDEIEENFYKLFRDNPDRLFLLVGSPRHYSVMEMLSNYDDMKDWARDAQKQFDNVRVVIFEDSYPDDYFKDTGHLSLKGARVFSGQMREKFREIGLLFEGDESKSDWPAKPDDIQIFHLDP